MNKKLRERETKGSRSNLRENIGSSYINNPYNSYQNFDRISSLSYQENENSFSFDIREKPLESARQGNHYIHQSNPIADNKSYRFQERKPTTLTHALAPQYSNLNYFNKEKNNVHHVPLYKNHSIKEDAVSKNVYDQYLSVTRTHENVKKKLPYPFQDPRCEANCLNNSNQNNSTLQYSNSIKKRKLARVLPQSTIASYYTPFDLSYSKNNDPIQHKNHNVYEVSEYPTVSDFEKYDKLSGISENDWNQIKTVEKLLEKEQDVSLVQHLLEELYKGQDVHTKAIDQILISLFKNYLLNHSQMVNCRSFEAVREWNEDNASPTFESQVVSDVPLLDPYDSSTCRNEVRCNHTKLHNTLKCQNETYHNSTIPKLAAPYSNSNERSNTFHFLNCSPHAYTDSHQIYDNTLLDDHKKHNELEFRDVVNSLKLPNEKPFPPWVSQMAETNETSKLTSQLQFSEHYHDKNDNDRDPLNKFTSCSDKSVIENPIRNQFECNPKKVNRLEHSNLNGLGAPEVPKKAGKIILKKCCPIVNEGIQQIHTLGMLLGNRLKSCINHDKNRTLSYLNHYLSFSKLKRYQISSTGFPRVSFTVKNLGDVHPNKTKYPLLPKCIVLEQLFLTPELYARFTPNAQCYRVADASGSLILCIIDVTLTNQSKENHFANIFITSKFKHQLQPSTIIQISDAKLEWVEEKMILLVDSIDCVSIRKSTEFPFSREPDMSSFYDSPKKLGIEAIG